MKSKQFVEQMLGAIGLTLKSSNQPNKSDKEVLNTVGLDRNFNADGAHIVQNNYDDRVINANVAFQALSLGSYIETSDAQVIKDCRRLSTQSEITKSLQEIYNEVLCFSEKDKLPFSIAFKDDDNAPSESIRIEIQNAFQQLYNVINFKDNGLQWFKDWYVDGNLYLEKIIDANNPQKGIRKVISLDPLGVRQVLLFPKPDANGVYNQADIKKYYVFSNAFINDSSYKYGNLIELQYNQSISGRVINVDAIAHIDSGCKDQCTGRYTSYLKQAIAPYNNLKTMEESMVIFRLVRAPQRRVFYVDVSDMQFTKAEQFMENLRKKLSNTLFYNRETGAINENRHISAIQEDIFLPRRNGGRGTEISNLEGVTNQDMIEEVEYFSSKLKEALKVPPSRFEEPETPLMFGRGVQIERDEFRFQTFLDTLRNSFIRAFEDLLKTHLVLKKICSESDFEEYRQYFYWEWTVDNNFVEWKRAEVQASRLTSLAMADPFSSKYFSRRKIQKDYLRMDDKEIEEDAKQMELERQQDADTQFNNLPDV